MFVIVVPVGVFEEHSFFVLNVTTGVYSEYTPLQTPLT